MNLTIDFGAGEDNEIDGQIVVDAGATATLANMAIFDDDVGAAAPIPANGEGGVAGMAGANGDPGDPGQPGNYGTNGFGGADGESATEPGANAMGAVQNYGALALDR